MKDGDSIYINDQNNDVNKGNFHGSRDAIWSHDDHPNELIQSDVLVSDDGALSYAYIHSSESTVEGKIGGNFKIIINNIPALCSDNIAWNKQGRIVSCELEEGQKVTIRLPGRRPEQVVRLRSEKAEVKYEARPTHLFEIYDNGQLKQGSICSYGKINGSCSPEELSQPLLIAESYQSFNFSSGTITFDENGFVTSGYLKEPFKFKHNDLELKSNFIKVVKNGLEVIGKITMPVTVQGKQVLVPFVRPGQLDDERGYRDLFESVCNQHNLDARPETRWSNIKEVDVQNYTEFYDPKLKTFIGKFDEKVLVIDQVLCETKDKVVVPF